MKSQWNDNAARGARLLKWLELGVGPKKTYSYADEGAQQRANCSGHLQSH